ncbi:MCE family protein [Rhodoblastus acidophilus]|uniref:MCE family protein n=1 Tax=Candidatus Rhodoblastus alkanivorans TaxID=2954117 RepID=A0ABS9Z6Q9_9HYPH|nr:MlaD family protein [Candidatus Rhodoblastus alkanivorans]MCI4680230.1 MCE family protein [Candidatus Rhodoblastus alkanivorans]MCI4683333.1 MCE family protein [Candidatus Rhodoblastus alkanivorans]MDI4640646.1 MCE family protein [Rhodoblastus acidophilus]
METRANYALIGLFTLAVIIGAFGFIYWFKTYGQQTAHTSYVIHFNGSVSGLLNGAAVQFNGLKVGDVTELGLNPENPSQVYARISINANTPVKTDTKASLEFGGLTGVAWVALQGGSASAEPLPPGGVLEASGSALQSLLQKAEKLSVKADKVLGEVDSALTSLNGLLKESGPGITASVNNIQKLTGALADKSGNFLQSLDSIEPGKVRNIVRNTDEAMAKVNNLLGGPGGKSMISDISDAARSVRKLADSLNRFANTGLRQYEGLAVDGRKTLQDVDHAVKTIERDPQSIIFGRKPALPEYRGR